MKFKLSRIALAVAAAGAVGSASAVTVNPDRTGQVIILPYYNTNNNFVTNFEIVNTQNEYKIVKVRLRESGNSQDVIDFNIYMSPYDVWKGVVRPVERTVNGETVMRANLVSADNTCTLPRNDASLTINGVSGLKLNSTGWDMNVVYKDVTDADAREGYIEIIEVGNIDTDTYVDLDGDGATDDVNDGGAIRLIDAIKHKDGVPPNCEAIEKAWTNGVTDGPVSAGAAVKSWGSYAPDGIVYVGDDRDDGVADGANNGVLGKPLGGLYAFEVLLNTPTGSAFIADGTAIDHYSTKSQHYRPDDPTNFLLPSLASGDVSTTLVVDAGADGALLLKNWPNTYDATLNDGDSNTPRSGTNPLPIAHVLQAEAVINSYFVNPDFDGATEWVVTFPMKKHGIFNGKWHNGTLLFDDQTGEYTCSDKDANGDAVGAAVPGTGTTEGKNVCFKGRDEDVEVSVAVYDYEEGTIKQEDPGFTVSPVLEPETNKIILSREVNILTFAESGSSILGASVRTNINPGVDFKAGWAKLSFVNSSANGICLQNADLEDGTVQDDTAEAGNDTFINGGDPATVTCGVPVIGFAALQGRDFDVQSGTYFGETVEHRFERMVTPTANANDNGSDQTPITP